MAALDGEVSVLEQRLETWHRDTPASQWVAAIPGVGLLGATARSGSSKRPVPNFLISLLMIPLLTSPRPSPCGLWQGARVWRRSFAALLALSASPQEQPEVLTPALYRHVAS